MRLTYIFIFLELKPAVSFQLYKVKKALFLKSPVNLVCLRTGLLIILLLKVILIVVTTMSL